VSVKTSETTATAHKGRKPAELLVTLIETFTKAGDTVIDPFLGSGTTLLAAESTGRACIGGELNPEYCAKIVSRWQSLTGEKAGKA
jgi:DNA modification methylase